MTFRDLIDLGALLLVIDPPTHTHTHIFGHYHLETTWLPVNNDWYGEGEDEDAAESAQAADQLAREGGRGELPVAGEQLVSCLNRVIIITQTK